MTRNSNLVEETMELADNCRYLGREITRVHRDAIAGGVSKELGPIIVKGWK
jgi:hypothetical protein